jgi:hypothetical protein
VGAALARRAEHNRCGEQRKRDERDSSHVVLLLLLNLPDIGSSGPEMESIRHSSYL